MKSFLYTKEELKFLKKLNSPQKIQDFLDILPFNNEEEGYVFSAIEVLKQKKAHCMEGALFAAAVLEFHGEKPLLLDLRASNNPYDFDHVVTVFKKFGCFGAISKTNHAVLRYREPIYKNLRELALSYFHEYFLNTNGQKTLREYSELFDLRKVKNIDWRKGSGDVSEISDILDKTKHHKLLSSAQIRNLRKADKVEIEAGNIRQYK